MKMNITNESFEQNNQIDAFDGELMHPSLDIKNDILIIGFRYRSTLQDEKEIFVISHKGHILTTSTESFELKDKIYYLEKRNRKLMRIEDKWSIVALKQFVKDYAEFKPVTSLLRETLEQIIILAKKYIELENEMDYYLLGAWIVGTYFYPIFYAYPFLHIKAPKRSGKSQCLNFLEQLCFNAQKSRPSLPALGDTVDALRGTYLIDQADALWRKGNEELLDILADSYKKSGGKRRILNLDKRKGREILEFETYSPKVFASIKELPEDLRDRCLIIPFIRSQKNFPDPDNSNENWREIRGNLYKFSMVNFEIVDSMYCIKKAAYKKNKEILGRNLELWLPFEVILECCGMQEKAEEAKKRFFSQYDFSEYEPSDIEEETIKAILNQFQENSEVILTPKEISESIDADVFAQNDDPKQRAAKVGWAIKKFNLSSEKKSRTKDGVRYLFNKNKVEGIYNSYFKIANEPTPPASDDFNGLNIEEIIM